MRVAPLYALGYLPLVCVPLACLAARGHRARARTTLWVFAFALWALLPGLSYLGAWAGGMRRARSDAERQLAQVSALLESWRDEHGAPPPDLGCVPPELLVLPRGVRYGEADYSVDGEEFVLSIGATTGGMGSSAFVYDSRDGRWATPP